MFWTQDILCKLSETKRRSRPDCSELYQVAQLLSCQTRTSNSHVGKRVQIWVFFDNPTGPLDGVYWPLEVWLGVVCCPRERDVVWCYSAMLHRRKTFCQHYFVEKAKLLDWVQLKFQPEKANAAFQSGVKWLFNLSGSWKHYDDELATNSISSFNRCCVKGCWFITSTWIW